MERKNKVLTVIVTVLMLVIFGLVGFIIYDKVINKTNKPNNEVISNEIKEVDLSSSLVTSLKYPKFDNTSIFLDGERAYKNVNFVDMTRDELMLLASYETKELEFGDEELKNYPDYCLDGCGVYSADSIESNFKRLFGPDVDYHNGNLSKFGCGEIGDYDKEKKLYFASYACGGDTDGIIAYINKPYKAEQRGDYLYVYEYIQIIKIVSDYETDEVYVYLTNKDDKTLAKTTLPIDYNGLHKLMDKVQLETYKWTFKKQSDGNYYFYSGAWEN